MSTMTKAARAVVKAAGPGDDDALDEGMFKALVAVFGNVDSYGDVIIPGAFADTLGEYEKSGDPIPVVWSHEWADPFAHIGVVESAAETDDGLVVTGRLDLDNPKAEQVYRLLKGRRVRQFSFAFDVEDAGWGTRDGSEVFELRKLALHEVGPCLVGVNRETELQGVKAARAAFPPTKTTDPDGSAKDEDKASQVDVPDANAPTPAGDASARTPELDPASVAILAAIHNES